MTILIYPWRICSKKSYFRRWQLVKEMCCSPTAMDNSSNFRKASSWCNKPKLLLLNQQKSVFPWTTVFVSGYQKTTKLPFLVRHFSFPACSGAFIESHIFKQMMCCYFWWKIYVGSIEMSSWDPWKVFNLHTVCDCA